MAPMSAIIFIIILFHHSKNNQSNDLVEHRKHLSQPHNFSTPTILFSSRPARSLAPSSGPIASGRAASATAGSCRRSPSSPSTRT